VKTVLRGAGLAFTLHLVAAGAATQDDAARAFARITVQTVRQRIAILAAGPARR
jgi:hypothetical protein